MCGIVGYVGNKNATQVLINAPKNWNIEAMTVPVLQYLKARIFLFANVKER